MRFFIDGLFAAKIVFISILPPETSLNGGGFSEFVMQLSEKYAIFAPNKNQTYRRDKNRE
jgi:hypothetical protein